MSVSERLGSPTPNPSPLGEGKTLSVSEAIGVYLSVSECIRVYLSLSDTFLYAPIKAPLGAKPLKNG